MDADGREYLIERVGMEEELRDAIRRLCERYPDEYWQSLDRERAYPEKFVGELNDAGYLACMIPEEFGGRALASARRQ